MSAAAPQPSEGRMTQSERATVGIVGLGIMGLAYARNLCSAGFAVRGYDIVPEQIAALEAAGGTAAASPRAVAEGAEVVLLALPSVAALEAVCAGEDGLAAGVAAGAVIAEMSTLPLAAKEHCRARLEPHGAAVLDCPVSGTGAQAARRDLSIYASGDGGAIARAQPVFDALARETRQVGPFGAGTKLKFVANLLETIHNLAAAEALMLAEKAGLDLSLVYEAVCAGAGTSRVFELRGPMMVEGRYRPATMKLDVYMKDISLILDFAREVGCPTPLTAASLPLYVAALAEGRAKDDTAALFAVLQGLAAPKVGLS
jgi:3-hydroxyisobutyrate dehydrogenase-like beta-hydroxyacid dehydrogenase